MAKTIQILYFHCTSCRYNQGFDLHQRLNIIQDNWPYFLGFGLPITLLVDCCSDFMTSGIVFAILFPLCIIAAHLADVAMNAENVTLFFFWPTITVSNYIFEACGKFLSRKKKEQIEASKDSSAKSKKSVKISSGLDNSL